MNDFKLMQNFKCTVNSNIELHVYDYNGVINLECGDHDNDIDIYLSQKDEDSLRDMLNDRHNKKNMRE